MRGLFLVENAPRAMESRTVTTTLVGVIFEPSSVPPCKVPLLLLLLTIQILSKLLQILKRKANAHAAVVGQIGTLFQASHDPTEWTGNVIGIHNAKEGRLTGDTGRGNIKIS